MDFRGKAVLFDLDGTLVDSALDLTSALNAMLASQKLRAVDLAEVKSMVGDGALKLIERALSKTGGDASASARLLPEFLRLYEADASRHTRPYPGVIETLARFKQAGLALAVVTNKPAAASRLILDALEMSRFFSAVIGGDSTPYRKPHPGQLHAALTELGATPPNAIMVGDNHHDADAARAAGLRSVIVTYGYSHRPHAEIDADRLIDDFAALDLAFLGDLFAEPRSTA